MHAPFRGRAFPRAPDCKRSRRLFGDEGARELVSVEGPEIVELLTYPDQLHGQTELVGDRNRDTAFRRAVELRQDDTGDAGRFREELRLLHAVLPGRRVDDE